MASILTRQSWLSEGDRRLLLAILAGRPHLTNGQIIQLFEARSGRRLSRAAVSRARVRGYPSLDPARPRWHLTDAERAILERSCHRAAPRYSRAEIARSFALGAGRPIALSSVGEFLARYFEDSPQACRAARGGEVFAGLVEKSPT